MLKVDEKEKSEENEFHVIQLERGKKFKQGSIGLYTFSLVEICPLYDGKYISLTKNRI